MAALASLAALCFGLADFGDCGTAGDHAGLGPSGAGTGLGPLALFQAMSTGRFSVVVPLSVVVGVVWFDAIVTSVGSLGGAA